MLRSRWFLSKGFIHRFLNTGGLFLRDVTVCQKLSHHLFIQEEYILLIIMSFLVLINHLT